MELRELHSIASNDAGVEVMLPPIIQSTTSKQPKQLERDPPGVTWEQQKSPSVRFMYDLRIAAARHNPSDYINEQFTLKSQAIQIGHENPNTVRRQFYE